jgi:hypothetical protein
MFSICLMMKRLVILLRFWYPQASDWPWSLSIVCMLVQLDLIKLVTLHNSMSITYVTNRASWFDCISVHLVGDRCYKVYAFFILPKMIPLYRFCSPAIVFFLMLTFHVYCCSIPEYVDGNTSIPQNSTVLVRRIAGHPTDTIIASYCPLS